MIREDLKKVMSFNKEGKLVLPLAVFEVNGSYILGVYQGSISEFDILIKYRQKINESKWSNIRTPKHIHWAVDILIKLHEDRVRTKTFLDFLLGVWEDTQPIKVKDKQDELLTLEFLLKDCQGAIQDYEALSSKGEYSVKFLILLAKLLMVQEKTNLETAYMFGKLLEGLREGKDIFSIVSRATHNGR